MWRRRTRVKAPFIAAVRRTLPKCRRLSSRENSRGVRAETFSRSHPSCQSLGWKPRRYRRQSCRIGSRFHFTTSRTRKKSLNLKLEEGHYFVVFYGEVSNQHPLETAGCSTSKKCCCEIGIAAQTACVDFISLL